MPRRYAQWLLNGTLSVIGLCVLVAVVLAVLGLGSIALGATLSGIALWAWIVGFFVWWMWL